MIREIHTSHCSALGGSFAKLRRWIRMQQQAHCSISLQPPPSWFSVCSEACHVFLGCFSRGVWRSMLHCSHPVTHFRLSDCWLPIKFDFDISFHNALQCQLSWLDSAQHCFWERCDCHLLLQIIDHNMLLSSLFFEVLSCFSNLFPFKLGSKFRVAAEHYRGTCQLLLWFWQ